MGLTMAEKIAIRASGKESARAGDIVTVQVDLAMMHDSSGPRRIERHLDDLGATVWDASKVVLVTDHFTPANDAIEANILKITRSFANRYGIHKFHDAEGICHIVPVEMGYIQPGMMYVGADSHSTTAGAMGAFAIPVGSTDMLGVIVTGETWIKVPETIQITWHGSIQSPVMAKDMMLATIQKLGTDGATYQAVEYTGDGVYALPLEERLVLSNMGSELGAKAAMIAPDDVVFDFLRARGVTQWNATYPDVDATYARKIEFDASTLQPLVARPHSPENVDTAVSLERERVEIQQAYIGACTGAKYEDLKAAAAVLKGKQVARNVRLLIAPASVRMLKRAVEDGIVTTLLEAGAQLLPSGCGACAGIGHGILASGEVCISSTNRNFPGRMGNRDSLTYLASPATVAASAVTGYISDPRTVMQSEVFA